MEDFLSDRVGRIDASGIRKVFALGASLKDPINLSIGQPDFDVPDELKEAAIAAIRGGQNRYSQTAGVCELVEKVCGLAQAEFGWGGARGLISSGVSAGLLLSFMSLINPGDEVIIPDPYFVMYKHLVNLLGGKCVFVDSYPGFELPVDGIREAVSEKTKLIILNSPGNPTGAVYTAEQVKAVAEIAREKGIIVLSDEIYEKFSYAGRPPSIGEYYERSLVLRGFGKAYGMPGWRLGYVVCDECLHEVIEAMTKIQQYTFVCAPTPFQMAAITALEMDVSGHVADYKVKRDIICDGLGDSFEIVTPKGAFYVFIKAPDGMSGTEFVAKAIKSNVLIIPGNVFSERDTHFRISYATSNEKLRQGVEVLRGLV
ncbi:MAG: aminotransferase class I/II-fold pyridoxal phosphate-dependent enzyme [Planctomycetes bacterium]|nr:aminotransferase class I/II-fold pyridoxal phosphate-dependent enzyme [Planctomycetota bacterium]